MKTIRVVAAVICDSIEHKPRYFPPRGATENLKVAGNSLAGRSKPERLRSRQLSEKSVRNWMPRSGSET